MHTTDQGNIMFFLQEAGHDAARLYGHPTLPGHHRVADVLEPMHSLRHHLRLQTTGQSHGHTIHTTYYRSEASSPLPKGRYGDGNHVQDSVYQNDGILRCELGRNRDNGESTHVYLFILVGGPLSLKTALQYLRHSRPWRQNSSQ